MKHFITIILCFTSILVAQAKINGAIIDTAGNPVEFANVTLWQDSVFITGVVSDVDGNFLFDKDYPSANTLKVTLIGFVPYSTGLKSTNTGAITITLNPDSYLLDEFTVTGERPTHKITKGGVSTKVQNTTLSLLGNAMDVIAQQPGVKADDGDIQVFGKGTPEVYLNGRKLTNYNELYQLSAKEIDNIEVITSPGSKYGAEVKSVILVKTVKKQGDGLSGTMTAGIRLAHYWGQSDNMSLNYRVGNVDIFSSFAFDYAKRYQEQRNNTSILCGNDAYSLLSDITIKPESTFYNAVGGINWRINNKNAIGVRYEYQGTPSNPSSWVTHELEKKNGKSTEQVDYLTDWKRSNTPSNILNAYYNGSFGNFSVVVNNDFYSSTNRAKQSIQQNSSVSGKTDIISNSKVKSTLYASKGVVEYKLGSNTLEGGYDYTHTDRQDYYKNEGNSLPDADDRIKEQTVAGFVGITIPINKLEIYGNLRYEHTNSDYYQNGIFNPEQSRKYDRLFPNIDFSFPISKANFTLSYNLKTKRPRYSQLSSSIQYDDRFTYETGNPLLNPELIHDISLAGIYKWIYFAASYQYVHDAIVGVVEVYNEGEPINLMTYKNYNNVPKYSVILSLSPRVSRWSPRLICNLLGQSLEIPSIGGDKKLNNPLLFVNFYNSFSLGRGFAATGDIVCHTSGDMDVVTMKPSWQINLGITKTLKNWYFQLNATDIFKTARNSMITYGTQMKLDKWNYSDTQALKLTIRYSFNSVMNSYKGKSAGQAEKARL